MPKFFIKQNQIENNQIKIIGNDINHIKNVLRAKVGEEIEICNSDLQENYICKIKTIEKEKINLEIIEKISSISESNIKVTIFQGIPKADKMELIIQKSVELGVYDITPVEMKRCVVKLQEKDKIKKIERWQKISEVAAKQSGRDYIPKVNNCIRLKEILNQRSEYDEIILAYEKEKENTLKQEISQIKQKFNSKLKAEELKIGIIIGPEGGIDEEEEKMLRENGIRVITLGNRILRTETVALNMLSIIMYELEERS